MALKRELAAAVAIPVVLAVLFLLPAIAFDFLVSAVTLAALWEFYRLAEKAGLAVAKTVGFFGSIVLLSVSTLLWRPDLDVVGLAAGFPLGARQLIWILLLITLLAALGPLFAGVPLPDALPAAGSTVFGILSITLPATALCHLRDVSAGAVLFLLLLVWGCDSFAYYTGKNFGRHKLAPRISPNKTWEGTIGGLLGAMIVGAAAGTWWVLPQLGPARGALAAASASTAGQLGDLVESMWKRGAGVKDSGVFLPGHGGFYDRIDSILFAGPVLTLFVASVP